MTGSRPVGLHPYHPENRIPMPNPSSAVSRRTLVTAIGATAAAIATAPAAHAAAPSTPAGPTTPAPRPRPRPAARPPGP
ncbi:hypothetical protein [Streptomyces sp. TLI_053]|uniref:hypothetical protein n=1 Tax=Streptomyces sp. TLI_053 TaxID=1855352 RepID=UPI000B86C73D|nr:hypothetical protein [Streptomyces sp. TLI_053]